MLDDFEFSADARSVGNFPMDHAYSSSSETAHFAVSFTKYRFAPGEKSKQTITTSFDEALSFDYLTVSAWGQFLPTCRRTWLLSKTCSNYTAVIEVKGSGKCVGHEPEFEHQIYCVSYRDRLNENKVITVSECTVTMT